MAEIYGRGGPAEDELPEGALPVVGDDRHGHEAQEDRHHREDHRSVHLNLFERHTAKECFSKMSFGPGGISLYSPFGLFTSPR